ncbi:MAG: preprotein translocase subunit SecY [Acidimicrobiia bacterium]|nr:preprotein translocase subunit SecY [Acidimicrobiia bacterium]MBT8251117.1 preprotein translocase subunit SecY [Acidimicrobiia bacterium]NNC42300.1 preprotein translocase subunit SecY [Acidimicrobiia bacterium]NND12746.1 preprotein translocase subunit SecY [Acidimicrobiia bacterium]NNL29281.1 preprotein translocase subunit SecY [Acidimicrobiia bacterium]
MLSVYRNMFKVPDLRNKILFTLYIVLLYRIGAAIPSPGVDPEAVQAITEGGEQNGIIGLLSLFSGGALEQLSVFALGVIPYITASIIMQLLTGVIPRLQKMQEEGEGHRITQWTRYATVVLAVLQAFGFTFLFRSGSLTGGINPITNDNAGTILLVVVTMTAGTALVMWLAELITQRGIGNGMSLLIFINIVSALPGQFGIARQTSSSIWIFVLLVIIVLLMVVGIIFVEQGQRRIPIRFAKRVRGRRVMGGNTTYIPLKVNNAGVIPVIFAVSVLAFPAILVTIVPSSSDFWVSIRNFINDFSAAGSTGISSTGGLVSTGMQTLYISILFLLVVFFTYFYTALQFDPTKQAEQVQRQGGYIQGIRPGRPTAEHLEKVISRITLPGAVFLGVIAILPAVLSAIFNIQFGFGGTSILIVVGVALETMKQVESQLMMRDYDGFLA